MERLQHADDFLVAPFQAAEMVARIRRLLGRKQSRVAQAEAVNGLDVLIGESPELVTLKRALPRVAASEASVLISGETGTGKELVARAIHYVSTRVSAPFVAVDCGAIPVPLFENEFFGHRGGAFTDARHPQPGVIAEAEGGTLFLDEIDALPLAAQAKLLRFVQSHSYRPLGGGRPLRANVRVLAATNVDLGQSIAEGSFRRDLYYRLNVIPLHVPPLRERMTDVSALAQHFIEKWALKAEVKEWRFEAAALHALAAYRWPGNVRELENLVRQILAMSPAGPIGLDALPLRPELSKSGLAVGNFRRAKAEAMAEFERAYARRLLAMYGGNVTQAARAAGQDRRAFGRLVKKHGIKRDA
jgi:DNA-binding NtrC family response regulator